MSKCVPTGMGAVSCPGGIGFVSRCDKSACHFCWLVGCWGAGAGELVRHGWRSIEPDGADIVAGSVIIVEAVGDAIKCYE